MPNDNTPYSPKKWAGLDRKGKFLCQAGNPFVAVDAKMAQKFKTTQRKNNKRNPS